MKTIQALAISFFLFIQGYQLNAQQDWTQSQPKQKKWSREMGLHIYALTIRKGDVYSRYENKIDNYAASGLYLKFYRGKNAIRTSVDYFHRINLKRKFEPNDRIISFKTLQLASGYQRHFGNKNYAICICRYCLLHFQ